MSYYLIDDVTDLVRQDGLPRVSRAKDDAGAESLHVVYLDGAAVRSMLAADWLNTRGALPLDPTPEQVVAALAAREAARQQAEADTAASRQRVLTAAQSAVGVALNDLTIQQRNALVALLLYKAGALDKDGKVKQLGEWVR